jgi:membrane dipeptidase
MAKRPVPGTLPVLDAHCDSLILREARGDALDFAGADPAYHVDLPRMRRGGLQAAFVMVGDSDLAQSSRLIDAVHRMARTHPSQFAVCRSAQDVRRAWRAGQVALAMSIESQTLFGEQIAHLANWHRLGVRVASLTHGEGRMRTTHALQVDDSFFGYLSPEERATLRRQTRGLTPFARESLGAMAELGMAVDLAHANDTAFWETLECFDGPVCVTHGNCYSLCRHTRNLTDDMMRALAARGGVLGVCFFGYFVHEAEPTLQRLADHFLHALEVMGPDHVGIGTDFDGIGLHVTPVIEHAGRLGRLWKVLRRRGVAEPTLRKIAHGNFLRLLH